MKKKHYLLKESALEYVEKLAKDRNQTKEQFADEVMVDIVKFLETSFKKYGDSAFVIDQIFTWIGLYIKNYISPDNWEKIIRHRVDHAIRYLSAKKE